MDSDAGSRRLVRVIAEETGWHVDEAACDADLRGSVTLGEPDVIVLALSSKHRLDAMVREVRALAPSAQIVMRTDNGDRAAFNGLGCEIAEVVAKTDFERLIACFRDHARRLSG